MITRRKFIAGSTLAMTTEAAVPQYKIIDPHVHVWTHDPKFPWAKETTKPPKEEATVEMLLDLMKTNGISHTVLVQYIGYRWDNSYTLDSFKRFPKQLQGVARVNPNDSAAPDHASKLAEQGFKGIRLSPGADASGDWIRGPLMAPLWKRVEELKIPMLLLAPITRIPDMAPLIEKNPELTVVIDHMADSPIDKPELLEKLLDLERFPKVFVKISHTWQLSKQEYPFRDTFENVKRLHARFGPQRLMWGTDWPVCLSKTTYPRTLQVVRNEMKFLNEDDKSWILSKTVERIWKFS